MHTTGMSFKAIVSQMGYHCTIVSRLVRKHTQTNNLKDLSRSGRPRVTSDRDDRALQRLARRIPFATSPVLKQHWLPNRRLSTRTVRNRLKSAGHKSRRVIKRSLLVNRHRRSRLACCLARRGWNLRTWRKIHWSDESALSSRSDVTRGLPDLDKSFTLLVCVCFLTSRLTTV
jgi:hypothetical protein